MDTIITVFIFFWCFGGFLYTVGGEYDRAVRSKKWIAKILVGPVIWVLFALSKFFEWLKKE